MQEMENFGLLLSPIRSEEHGYFLQRHPSSDRWDCGHSLEAPSLVCCMRRPVKANGYLGTVNTSIDRKNFASKKTEMTNLYVSTVLEKYIN